VRVEKEEKFEIQRDEELLMLVEIERLKFERG